MRSCSEANNSISVVTANYNGVDTLEALVNSLRSQTDPNFEWIVADGESTDGSLSLLRSIGDLNIIIISQRDFGIYDALNRAIDHASGCYYIVAGSDDVFESDAIANYRYAIGQSNAEILTSHVKFGDRHLAIKHGPQWLYGEKSYIAFHSLGTAFKKDLHARFGMYSRKFPVAADSYFVICACKGGATRHDTKFLAGQIGTNGVSAVDWIGSATELYRAQVLLGGSFAVQTFLLMLRLIRGVFRVR